jgi:hypothetical protein
MERSRIHQIFNGGAFHFVLPSTGLPHKLHGIDKLHGIAIAAVPNLKVFDLFN